MMLSFVSTHALKKYAILALFPLMSNVAYANMYVESVGFGGQHWEFRQPAHIAAFNQTPIRHGYSFIFYRNPYTQQNVNAFVVHNGEHLSLCSPDVEVVLPLLRGLVQAYLAKDLTQQVIIESEVQKNLISTCEVSFNSGLELKRLFNRAAGHHDMPGLAAND